MLDNAPILEFDSNRSGLITPGMIWKSLNGHVPEHAVICFFQDVIDKLKGSGLLREIYTRQSEMGPILLYSCEFAGQSFVLFHPGIGAPLSAAILEGVIALGCKKFIACGGCGVLNSDIAVGQVLIPVAAVRDEGTSYHYLPAGREVKPSAAAVVAIEKVLKAKKIEYQLTKTWTTDGLYRETPDKISLRKSEGCQVVEMEAAAFFAVAEFRGVQLAQMLYGGDDVGGETWENRGWQGRTSIREQLLWLAAEACLAIED